MMLKRFSLIAVILVTALTLSAQTYQGGIWYSLYDNETHTMNTQGDYETGSVFAPTAGTLNVQWNYEWIDWLGAFRKIDTDVLESANSGSSTNQVGSLAENTDNGSQTTESFNVSRNINWIKFDRSGLPTHKVNLQRLDIRLAQHILLASGTYGTTSGSHDFGTRDALTASEAYHVNLRSFLTAGDITISSSEPTVFRLGSADNTQPIVYAVGANACASANGTAETAGGSALGKIANYGFDIYFVPQEGIAYTAQITISDGVSTAQLTVTGSGDKLPQTITWEPELTILSSDTIALANASSGLPVVYTFEPDTLVSYENGAFLIHQDGVVTITASQPGNTAYNAAEPVSKTITIHPAKTYYHYEAEVCEGVSYSDEHFADLSETGVYFDTIPNAFGGDSIISLGLTIHPVYHFVENDTIFYGDETSWQGIDLSLLPIGDSTLVTRYETTAGCDSVYTLHLTVLAPTTYGEVRAAFCQGDSVYFEGSWYKNSVDKEVLLDQKNRYGADSIVRLIVDVHPTYAFADSMTTYQGESGSWQAIDLSALPICDTTLVAAYQTIYGCDSTYTLSLQVRHPRITTYSNDTLLICAGEQVEYEGKTYKRSTKDSVLLTQKNRFDGDSIVLLVVQVLPAMRMKVSKTISQGEPVVWEGFDLSTLPVGDTTLVAAYQTVYGCDSTFTLRLTVQPRITVNISDTLTFCEGDSAQYRGRWYDESTVDSFFIQGTKTDTMYHVLAIKNLPAASQEERTVFYGETEVWNGYDLSELTTGEHQLVYSTRTAAGCDSVVTLTLTVVKQAALVLTRQFSFCAGDSVEYRGNWYDDTTLDTITIPNEVRDTVIYVEAVKHMPSATTEAMTITVGDEGVWNGQDLSELTVGEHQLVYATQNAAGCDSVVTLTLTVVKQNPVVLTQLLSFCAGDSVEYRGKWYITSTLDTITIASDMRDTVIYVEAVIIPNTFSAETMTITAGDDETWNGQDLSELTVGEYLLTYSTRNAGGCDSIVTLTLTVVKQATLELAKRLTFCEGDSVEYMGRWYYEETLDTITISGEVRDTVIYVMAIVLPLPEIEVLVDTVVSGDTIVLPEGLWFIDPDTVSGTYITARSSDTTELVFRQKDESYEGCGEAITELRVMLMPYTDKSVDPVATDDKSVKVYRDGIIYIRRGDRWYDLNGHRIQ